MNHNIPAADLLLREMEQHQAPSGSDSDEDSATHIVPPQTLASQPASEPHMLGQQQPNAVSSPQTLKAPAPPTSRVSKRPSFSRGRKQTVEGEDGEVDLYYKYRGEALKLSRRWHKKLHQSANAFAAAQFSGKCSHPGCVGCMKVLWHVYSLSYGAHDHIMTDCAPSDMTAMGGAGDNEGRGGGGGFEGLEEHASERPRGGSRKYIIGLYTPSLCSSRVWCTLSQQHFCPVV